jgi:hypothetical protein
MSAKKAAPPRADTDPTRKTIILEGVPRDLFDRALAKGRAQEPPIPLKWKIIELVRAWVEEGGPA